MWLQCNSSTGRWMLREEGPVGGGGELLVRMRGSCRVQRTVLGLPNAAPGVCDLACFRGVGPRDSTPCECLPLAE